MCPLTGELRCIFHEVVSKQNIPASVNKKVLTYISQLKGKVLQKNINSRAETRVPTIVSVDEIPLPPIILNPNPQS